MNTKFESLSIATGSRSAAFSLVELLATVAIIGLISFLAIPHVVNLRSDGEKNLAIARAESLNMAVASMIQVRGRIQAGIDWAGKDDNMRYKELMPYLGFAEANLASYLPSGYDVDFSDISSGTLNKVVLKDSSNQRIYY